VNECFVLLLTTNLFLFTDFVQDQNSKYVVAGWGYCFFLSVCIIFNFSYIFKDVYLIFKLRLVKYSNIGSFKYEHAK
jgi:hypothetical protein